MATTLTSAALGVCFMPGLAGKPGDKTPLNYALPNLKDVPQLSKTPLLTGHRAAVAGKLGRTLKCSQINDDGYRTAIKQLAAISHREL